MSGCKPPCHCGVQDIEGQLARAFLCQEMGVHGCTSNLSVNVILAQLGWFG